MGYPDKMMRRFWLLTLILFATLLASPSAFAADNKKDRKAELQRKIKATLHKVLKKRVGLDDKQAEKVEKILESHREERTRLKGELKQARKRVAKLVKSDSDDEAAFKKAIKELRNKRKQQHQLQEKQFDELGKVLTSKQQARLFVTLQRVKRRMRRAQRGARKGKKKGNAGKGKGKGEWGDFE